MSKSKKPEILSAEVVAKSRLFTVEQVHLRFSNGQERHYERMKGGGRGAVLVVPVLNGDTLLLIREYSAGTHSYELGFPKGLIDPGEDMFAAASREMQEEIGYKPNSLTHLKEVSLAPGFFQSKMDIFLAEDLRPSRLDGDEPEPLEVVPWPIAQLEELLVCPDFSESRSMTGLFLALKQMKLDPI